MQTPGIRHSVAFMPASGAAISAGGECDRVLLHVPPIYNGQPLPEFGLPPAPLTITPLSKRPAVCPIPHHFVTSLYWFLGMASPEVCTPPAATPPLSKDEAIDRSFSATGRTLISSSEGQREDLIARHPMYTLFHLAKWDFVAAS
ncbi:uncharacterized protein CCOS01_02647 [Colletotrichum costaricense]|uniref:Uncharacterized protein n=1 Tax=Colletotrichum costaricense TaxID=1209916 RepID=A0AAI9Z803_9PEZI|nr:uncharacterized protein CCOS01_02647 [Colletotrichum costaricense]KAK1537327.1 hypothetical protein CCOS01_02647 [Colletotrichum costaricense]